MTRLINSLRLITLKPVFWWGLLSLAVLCLIFPDAAWARAGGGGGFGGGGGGGFGGGGGGFGGGGGSGGGDGIFRLLVYLCWHHPLIGYPVVIGIVGLLLYGGVEAKEHHVTRVIRKGRSRQADRIRVAALESIKEHDPAFELSDFLERAEVAFKKIQYAWSAQNLSSVRAFISDGIHERFSMQVGMQQAEGFRNVMEDVAVTECEAVAIFSTGSFDTIHLQISASAKDYNADLKTGKKLTRARDESFTEYWSFYRRPGAKSVQGTGAIEGNCPRCAAPLKIVDRADCSNCGARVNSGEFDWVLGEITQEQEWLVPGSEEIIPGVAALRAEDPGFDVQHIEDRVSVMFWRLRASEFYDDIKHAEPVLSARYRDVIAQELQGPKFWAEPAVGKVEILDVQLGDSSAPDALRVKVRWSAILKERTGSQSVRVLRQKTIYTHVFVLHRIHGVQSTPQAVFTSAGCTGCGAPIDVNSEGACVYCGAILTTGKHDWILDDVQPFTAALAYDGIRPLGVEIGSEPDRAQDGFGDAELSLAVLAKVMWIDGELHDQERQTLRKLGAHRNLTSEQIDQIIQQTSTERANIPTPETSSQAQQHLRQLIHAVLADGQISRPERKMLSRYAEHVGLATADVRLAIANERRQAYQSARAELRRESAS